MPAHRPSVVGCLFGFAAAGAGIGSVLGMGLGDCFAELELKLRMSPDERAVFQKIALSYTYDCLFTGVALGILFGAITGTVYAIFTRRWLAAVDPESPVPPVAPGSPP